LKTVNIDPDKPSENLGHCPKNPQGQVIAGIVDVVKTVCMAVRNLIGAVE
jgi:hypothetical protein